MIFRRTTNPKWVHGNSTLWRYLPLDRFIEMLESNSIFFPRASEFTDMHEFTLPESTANNFQRQLGAEALETAYNDIEQFRITSFVSCWTKQTHESYLLWKIYLRDSKYGVAIKTKANQLRKSLTEHNQDKQIKTYHIEVQYRNHIPLEQLNSQIIASRKREFYDGENESRMFFSDPDNLLGISQDKKGISLNFDPMFAINEVYLSPFGGKSFNDAFQEMLVKRYSWLSNRVKQSEILDS